MKIVVAGGRNKADFLIGSLLTKKHKLIVINDDQYWCEHLSAVHGVNVFCGDPSRKDVLQEAEIEDSDVLIALTPSDADNLAICQYAKKYFNVGKVLCTVSNPKNVEIFRKFNVDTAISATYMVAKYIEHATTVKNIIKTFSFEEEDVVVSEVIVDPEYKSVGKKIMDLKFPANAIIGCIVRRNKMLIPNGMTEIRPNDKLLIMSSSDNQQKAIEAIEG